MDNMWKPINQSSYTDLNDKIDELKSTVNDKKIIINKITQKILKLQGEKDALEKTKEEVISFMKSSFIKRLKYVMPSRKDSILFIVNTIINIFLGIAIGKLFLPFGLIFIGVFYYGAHPYFKEAHEKWKALKSKKPDQIKIKIVWRKVEIFKLDKTIEEIECEIADLKNEIKKLVNQINQSGLITTYVPYETTCEELIKDKSNYCKSYKVGR
jgi:predicted RNase H-like nuclease (RuvC/YqgF family)